jgi:hypothetical protein
LAVSLKEHQYNLKEGLCGKSKLAAHAIEVGHMIAWDQSEILQIESNPIFRKYKETAHMICSNNPISQASLEMSPLWFPLIAKELKFNRGQLLFLLHRVLCWLHLLLVNFIPSFFFVIFFIFSILAVLL